MAFLTQLNLLDDPQPDMWVIGAPLVWEDSEFGHLEVPLGFRTDLASIPRALRNLTWLDPNGISRKPAAMHDWLYAAGRRLGKDYADHFLRASLLVQGASAGVAWTFYQAVHLFGASSWEGDARALATRDFDTPAHWLAFAASKDARFLGIKPPA